MSFKQALMIPTRARQFSGSLVHLDGMDSVASNSKLSRGGEPAANRLERRGCGRLVRSRAQPPSLVAGLFPGLTRRILQELGFVM